MPISGSVNADGDSTAERGQCAGVGARRLYQWRQENRRIDDVLYSAGINDGRIVDWTAIRNVPERFAPGVGG